MNENKEELRYNPPTLSYISVYSPPTKTTYFAGEYFDATGMVIKAHYSDGTSQIVNTYIYTPQSALTEGTTYVTISYQSVSVNQSITVLAPYATIIDTMPNKLIYQIGECFEPDGMVVKFRSFDSVQVVTGYSFSPSGPLSSSNGFITVTYNGYPAYIPITVNNNDTNGPFPTQYTGNSNLGDNPYFNLFDQSLRFMTDSITVGRDSYALSFNLLYYSSMKKRQTNLINCLPDRFKTNYHQYLLSDGIDNNNHAIFKYIDADNYIHIFNYVNNGLYYCRESNLFLTFYTSGNNSYAKIIDSNNNELHFNANGGVLVKIINSKGTNNIKNIVYSNGLISYVYDVRDSDTRITFVYNNSNLLVSVCFIYQGVTIKTLLLNYSGAYLTSVDETDNSNHSRCLYSFFYDYDDTNSSYGHLEYIHNELSHQAYNIQYVFDNNYAKYVVNVIKKGTHQVGSAFLEQDSLTRVKSDVRNDGTNSTSQTIVKTKRNVFYCYHLDRNATITASFESDQYGGSLKTTYKETGVYLDINGNQSASINGHAFKNISSGYTFALTNNSSAMSLINRFKHFVLRLYVKINNSASSRIKAVLSSGQVRTRITNLNIDQYEKYQLVEIPFSRETNSLSSLTMSLSFVNENNSAVNADIADVYIDKKDKTTLVFFNGQYLFDELEELKLYGASPDDPPITLDNTMFPYFSENDFLNTLLINYTHPDFPLNSQQLLFLCNGRLFEFFQTSFIGSNQSVDFIHPNHLSNSDLDAYDCWYFLTESADGSIQNKKYYRTTVVNNENCLQIITRRQFTNDNSTFSEETRTYKLNGVLISVKTTHNVDNNLVVSETFYEYFPNGETKKITMDNGVDAEIVLYSATQNSNGYLERKTSGLDSAKIEYTNNYLETAIIHQQVINGTGTDTTYKKCFAYDSYNENLTSVAFMDNTINKGTNKESVDYVNKESSYSINNSPLFKTVLNNSNDTIILKRYTGSTFENVFSIKKTISSNKFTYYTGSSNVYIENSLDNYGRIVGQSLNYYNKVTFSYDTNPIESLAVADLLSVTDLYIGKTTSFSYNGYDYSELSSFDNGEFEIKHLYNGFYLYSFNADSSYEVRTISSFYTDVFANNTRLENVSVKYVYDSFNRLLRKDRVKNNNSSNCFLRDSFSYQSGSLLCSSFQHINVTGNNPNLVLENYGYDAYGNLSSIDVYAKNHMNPNSQVISWSKSFGYDGFNRIISESNTQFGISRTYSYDSLGRMSAFGNDSITYNAKGQLTNFGSYSYTYDRYGNRTKRTINNQSIEYKYERGELLKQYGSNIYFQYDYRGLRYKKSTPKEDIVYYYDGNKLIGEDHSGKQYAENNVQLDYPSFKLRFFYGEDGLPIGLRYIYSSNNQSIAEDYVYVVNAFKEIVGLSRYDSNTSSSICSLEVYYVYDAWGNHKIYDNLGVERSNDYFFIGSLNPLRFRNYYYDKETNLFYLRSKYYDPQIGQYITPNKTACFKIESRWGLNPYAYIPNCSLYAGLSSSQLVETLATQENPIKANEFKSLSNSLSPYQGWFYHFLETDKPQFFIFSKNEIQIISWELKTTNKGYAFNDNLQSQIYNSSGNISLFIGSSISSKKGGAFVGVSVGRIAFENRFVSIYFDFLTAKFNIGVENGKWTLDYGFGWFDVGISLNFGEIIKSFLEWLSGGK